MAVSQRKTEELRGPALADWEESKRVALPGGGTMYVPLSFVAVPPTLGREQSPKYAWRDAEGAVSVTVELISWHHAMQLTAARYARTMRQGIEAQGGTLLGEIEPLMVNGYGALYGRFRHAAAADTDVAAYGVYARLLTRNAGFLFEAMHPDRAGVDRLAKAVLLTLAP